MSVDASAVARVLGISVEFKDLRGSNAAKLPQRIAVIAQGASASVFSTTKFQSTGPTMCGNKVGFGSPAHAIVEQLQLLNGDGSVGTILVDVYLVADDGSGVAAAGDVTPSGTGTAATASRLRIGGVLSNQFVSPKGALGAAQITDLLRGMGNAVAGVLSMLVVGTYAYGTVTASALTGTGNGTITVLSAAAPAKPGIYTLKVTTAVANGGVWTMTDPDGVVLSSSITMTAGVGAATPFTIAGVSFTLTDGTTDFGLGATFLITVPATKINFTAKWKGATGNKIKIEVIDGDPGVTYAITQPTGGLVNPSIAAALGQIGNVWETMIINGCGDLTDSTILDALQTFGEGRWGTLVHKPLVAFTGNTDTDVAVVTALTDARKTDRVNAALVAPGSPNLPCVVAARQVARIAKQANDNPPVNYGGQSANGIVPGADGVQWDYPTRDLAIKAGCSSVEVNDGVVQIANVVTFYHPSGDPSPAYRYVVDIVKLQQCIYNTALRFNSPEWAGAPLIPDKQPTTNPKAKKPRMAVADMAAVLDGLGLDAVVADPEAGKKTISAGIDTQNSKRLNLDVTFQISGNAEIIDVPLKFGFLYGTPAVVG